MQEGLSIGLHAPSVIGTRGILVAALRARRAEKDVDGKSTVVLEFDDKEKIHPITEQILAVETHKPTYLTSNGAVPINFVFQNVSDSLKEKEINTIDAARNLQANVQREIVDNLDVEQELLEFVEDFLLAAPMKYPELKVERTCSNPETASVDVYGKFLANNMPFNSVLTLPAVRFMVSGLDFRNGKVVPNFYDVSAPGRIKKLVVKQDGFILPHNTIGGTYELFTDLYDSTSLEELRQKLSSIPSNKLPLSFDEATRLVADSITANVRKVLKLKHNHLIPVQMKMINP